MKKTRFVSDKDLASASYLRGQLIAVEVMAGQFLTAIFCASPDIDAAAASWIAGFARTEDGLDPMVIEDLKNADVVFKRMVGHAVGAAKAIRVATAGRQQ